MPSRLTLELPLYAVDKLMDGYRRNDPELMAMFAEFRVVSILSNDEQAVSAWENEGGKCHWS